MYGKMNSYIVHLPSRCDKTMALGTVNQIIFAPINFRVFVMCIFAMIYFRGVQNCTKQEQSTVCLLGHFRGDLLLRILLSHENRENKSHAKIN